MSLRPHPVLLPAAWLYGAATALRNAAFGCGVLEERTYGVPVISVGNLAAGGTGKTPHVEYLLRWLLGRHLRVATVSRGYGRRTKGFREVSPADKATDVGDEPLQLKLHFPKARVTVCESRRKAVEQLLSEAERPDVVLLDDAYQHRYVKPRLNILLTDYACPYSRDHLLPAGYLRESRSGASRADVVIVTKCPPALSPAEAEAIRSELHLKPQQHLFFTTMVYGTPYNPYGHTPAAPAEAALLVSGIARPEPLAEHLRRQGKHVTPLIYPDHHTFSQSDWLHVAEALQAIPAKHKDVVTTEKDFARFRNDSRLPAAVADSLQVVPIATAFLLGGEEPFRETVLNTIT